MRRIICFLVAGLLILGSCSKPKVKVRLTNQIDTVSYYLGLYYAKSLKANPDFDKINSQAVAMAFDQIFSKDSVKVTEMEIQMKLNDYFKNLQKKGGEKALKEGRDFLEKNKTAAGVSILPDGVQYQVLKTGTGPKPDSTDVISINYTGMFIDGKKFDSNVGKEPAKFALKSNIAGFREALLHMNVGSKWKVFIPSELAWGERGAPPTIKPNSVVIFEVELLGIEPKTAAPKKK